MVDLEALILPIRGAQAVFSIIVFGFTTYGLWSFCSNLDLFSKKLTYTESGIVVEQILEILLAFRSQLPPLLLNHQHSFPHLPNRVCSTSSQHFALQEPLCLTRAGRSKHNILVRWIHCTCCILGQQSLLWDGLWSCQG